MSILTAVLGFLEGPIDSIARRIAPDKDEAQRIAGELKSALLMHQSQIDQAAARIVLAEAQGESWLQRNWRPLAMITIVAIIANNYILAPYLALFGIPSIQLELPEPLWDLMKIGMGGYIVGRSTEKAVKAWRAGD